MPGLMARASTIVKSKFSKLLDRAEDPCGKGQDRPFHVGARYSLAKT